MLVTLKLTLHPTCPDETYMYILIKPHFEAKGSLQPSLSVCFPCVFICWFEPSTDIYAKETGQQLGRNVRCLWLEEMIYYAVSEWSYRCAPESVLELGDSIINHCSGNQFYHVRNYLECVYPLDRFGVDSFNTHWLQLSPSMRCAIEAEGHLLQIFNNSVQ